MTDEDYTKAVQQHLCGFDRQIGIEILEATPTRVRAQLTITAQHLQIHNVVHGGVYSSLVETAGSIGAALAARAMGRTIVGVDNHTSFLRATGQGVLRVEAEPLTVGRRTQVWSSRIVNDQGQLVATGQLRLLCLDAGTLPNAGVVEAGSPFRLD
jgi:1,4-dihydroxy-2-naphthoyl-CoA hydrolase